MPTGDDKVRILFLAASPAGAAPLALDEERRVISEKLLLSDHGRQFELIESRDARSGRPVDRALGVRCIWMPGGDARLRAPEGIAIPHNAY